MAQTAPSSVLPLFSDADAGALRRTRRLLLLFGILAILLHVAAMIGVRVDWLSSPAPAPFEVQQIDPAKLDAIRKQWKSKSLLVNPDKDRPKEQVPAPEDARYFSDRNIRVEKETRARDTAILPKSGAPGEPAPAVTAPAAPKSPSRSQPLPPLGNLGVPLKLGKASDPNEQRPKPAPESMAPRLRSGQGGGQQHIQDKSLPSAGETMLNAQESVFYSFYARLYEAIGPLWQSRINSARPERQLQPGDYLTTVEIALAADGSLIEVRRLESSGVAAFDQAIVDAWKKIARFPNPPKALLDKEGLIRIRGAFTVSVGTQTLFNYLPPEQVAQ